MQGLRRVLWTAQKTVETILVSCLHVLAAGLTRLSLTGGHRLALVPFDATNERHFVYCLTFCSDIQL